MTKLSVVGKAVPRVDILEKVTGKAKYCSDFKMPGMLYGKILRSPYAHARISRLDTSRAKILPAVQAVVGPQDAPPRPVTGYIADRFMFPVDGIVRFIGDPVAAVAADTPEIAEEALELIDVDYEELPAVFDVEEAYSKHPPVIVHPNLANYAVREVGAFWRPDRERPNVCQTFKIRTGDVDKAFQEVDLIVENRFTTTRISHCQLEPHQAIAWVDPDGGLVIRTSCQGIYMNKGIFGALFGLAPSKVRVISSYVGGGFGGKSQTLVEPVVALLALKTGRPVRIVFTREEMFVAGRHRISVITHIKDGVQRDGTLIAREIKVIADMGAHCHVALIIVKDIAFGAVATYRIPNLKLDSSGVYTNNPITGPFRGFGVPEILWAIEQQMDIVAEKLGIDPLEFRKKNVLREGEPDACGQVTHSIGTRECLDKVAQWIGWGKKTERAEGSWRIGKGIATGSQYTLGGTVSSIIVKVWSDSTIEIRHSADEQGQGINTTLSQIAAEEFGVSVDRIKVVRGDTDVTPYDFCSCSSRAVFHDGNALLLACQDAKQKLFRIAAPKLGVASEALETREGKVYVKSAPEKSLNISDLFTPLGIPIGGGEIIGAGSYAGPVIIEDPETGRSERMVAYYSHGAHAAEVAVNMETGEVKVLRIAGCFDMGNPINPKIVEGQIEGGFGMGIGSTLYEEVCLDKGVVVNPTFMDYKMPSATEYPACGDSKAMIAAMPHREGPFGAKGIGEIVVGPVAPAIANAVYNATGVRVTSLPMLREKILKAITEAETKKESYVSVV